MILCPHCGTEVVLDMAEFAPPVPPRPGGRNAFVPKSCPACQVEYQAIAGLEELQRGYRMLAKAEKGMVTFLVETLPDESTK